MTLHSHSGHASSTSVVGTPAGSEREAHPERGWTDVDKGILRREYPRRGAAACAKLLNRSKSAVYSMAGRLDLKRVGNGAPQRRTAITLTGNDISQGLGITKAVLNAWIRNDGLKASLHPDGWRVRRRALRLWIAEHPMAINLSKVNQEWFIFLGFSAAR